jgi:diaminohydroxyphosphoribosylaminopyrimidine deaminase/5-amino-6-(5-phosphoribosylamino)uracil reductase
MDHAHWMSRCLSLARLGAARAAPNPMVGAVLVHRDRVLAEGWHQRPGAAHAERDCLNRFGDGVIPEDAVLHVNLEPCAHQGRTPPCADLLISRGVKRVVIAHRDPFPQVNGEGLRRLRDHGVAVNEGVLEGEARWMNRRFLTSVHEQRPYITLKWAQSADGFLDDRGRTARISSAATDALVHRWRSEEQAILVGSRTVVSDDPRLDVRLVDGPSPLRVVLDRSGITASSARVFDGSRPTLLFTGLARAGLSAEQCVLAAADDPIANLLQELHRRMIRSLLVEGGAALLGHFIGRGLWDEARIIHGTARFTAGTRAPSLSAAITRTMEIGDDRIELIVNGMRQQAPAPAWPW